jgi:hypothetical protein
MGKLEIHPAAHVFPLMDGEEFEHLKDSIAEHGQLVPIALLDGKILDGRNRARACEDLGLVPLTVNCEMEGKSTAADVAEALNLIRRHLDAKSRAALAVKLRAAGASVREIAEKLEVGVATAHRAIKGRVPNGTPVANATPAPRHPLPVCQKCGEGHEPARGCRKVTGRDGKSYPATKPKTPLPAAPEGRSTP